MIKRLRNSIAAGALLPLLACLSGAAMADTFETIESAPLKEVWINGGFYSYHFDRDKDLYDSNPGLGAEYRFARAELDTQLPEYRAIDTNQRSDLHRLSGYALYNHSSGLFARFDAAYYWQANRGYSPDLPSDQFVQLDLSLGYHFARRRAQVVLGILNLTDTDYHLNPLTTYAELPRERVFFARINFRF